MGVVADFTVSADNLNWYGMNDLTELVVGKRFRTPTHFYENTILVFVNGLRVEKDNDDGYNVLDDETFEMKEAYPASFRISCGYVVKEV